MPSQKGKRATWCREESRVKLSVEVRFLKGCGVIRSYIGSTRRCGMVLKDLLSLDLSNNIFDGHIPEQFGDLISLESLDLSNNSLSGVIPKSLEELSFLNHFNVSLNRLEGEIPTGGPFRNFSAKSFMNNYGLCGSTALYKFHLAEVDSRR
ncbi:hypothetical protein PTKIN_Ptkin18bG0109700 [Pterospermum kingtungense]